MAAPTIMFFTLKWVVKVGATFNYRLAFHYAINSAEVNYLSSLVLADTCNTHVDESETPKKIQRNLDSFAR